MNCLLAGISALLMLGSVAHAHFVFVVPEAPGKSAKIFISETLQPDTAVDFNLVAGAKLYLRDASGSETPLELRKGTDAYLVALAGSGIRIVYGLTDLGLSQNGSTKPYLLVYHPKAIIGNAFDKATVLGSREPIEILPTRKADGFSLQLVSRGKALTNVEVTVILPDGSQKKLKTGTNGETDTLSQTGRYGAWARFWEGASGQRDGKKYDEVRHYATLVFDVPGGSASKAGLRSPGVPPTTRLFATLPEATASFGSVVSEGWLYIYGGHVAPTHSYSTAAVSGQFNRLRLSGPPDWESLPSGPAMQGMNLAEFDGKIYRIGGMMPRNRPGDPADNQSVTDCGRYNPATKKWEALPPLPKPRSSHDVVVVDGKLIVTGGWALGSGHTEWLDSIEILDLEAKKLEWTIAKQPFKRRALMAAAFQGKVYVIGGFDEKGQIVSAVSIYDPKTNVWSDGPKLPGGAGLTFAPAAGVHEGVLFVSVSDGTLLRLNPATNEWAKCGKATPRLAHRIAFTGESVLVIGGADNGKNSDLIEAIAIGKP